ncbi:hypothetical protein GW17_00011355 [Ensete ventricosum]|nr:hypothetical protein GW17_00011355 [Ensete ventricosum]
MDLRRFRHTELHADGRLSHRQGEDAGKLRFSVRDVPSELFYVNWPSISDITLFDLRLRNRWMSSPSATCCRSRKNCRCVPPMSTASWWTFGGESWKPRGRNATTGAHTGGAIPHGGGRRAQVAGHHVVPSVRWKRRRRRRHPVAAVGSRCRTQLSTTPTEVARGIGSTSPLEGLSLQLYSDFMKSFRANMADFLGAGIITDIEVGVGPAGELRYPSYHEAQEWVFPGIGAFQVNLKLTVITSCTVSKRTQQWQDTPEWDLPDDAGEYNDKPTKKKFFLMPGQMESAEELQETMKPYPFDPETDEYRSTAVSEVFPGPESNVSASNSNNGNASAESKNFPNSRGLKSGPSPNPAASNEAIEHVFREGDSPFLRM